MLPRNFITPEMFVKLADAIFKWLIKTKDMPEQQLTMQEKLDLAVKLITEVRGEMNGGAQAQDSGGSNPPSPGQPGHP